MQVRSTDRRQNNIPIESERRSGIDRRDLPKDTSVFEALEIIPIFRRVSSIPDKIDNGDTTTALGMSSLALINLPEDLRDIKGAINQLKGVEPKYNHKEYQHGFSFFRGTMIEEWLHKHADKGKLWANLLIKNDKPLVDTTFGEKILNIIKTEEKQKIRTQMKDFNDVSILATSYTGNWFKQITARALKRTTLLGLCVMCLLELPKIFKSKEKIKQTEKSTINVISITTGIGYGGAIGHKYGGNVGSLIGMAAGAIVGSKTSDKIQELT